MRNRVWISNIHNNVIYAIIDINVYEYKGERIERAENEVNWSNDIRFISRVIIILKTNRNYTPTYWIIIFRVQIINA